METTLSAKRKGDALITLRQNNNNHAVEVVSMNPAAENLTGYSPEELVGQRIDMVLPERISESFEENIEYDDPLYDFASVARKIPNFQIKNRRGRDIEVSLKVFHLASQSRSSQDYEILIRDIRLIKKIDELKKEIASDVGTSEETNIGNLMHAYNTAYKFIAEYPIEVSFVTFGIDSIKTLEAQDEMTKDKVIANITKTIHDTCRDEDIASYIDNGVIGIVLLDCNTNNARDVINRVIENVNRKEITLFDGSSFNTSLTASYVQLGVNDNPNEVFNDCVDQTLYNQQRGGNSISMLYEDEADLEDIDIDEEYYEDENN